MAVSLQQRILDVLVASQKAVLAHEIYANLGGDTERGPIDCALGGLVRNNMVVRENAGNSVCYSLKSASRAEEGIPTAEEEAAASLSQKLSERTCSSCRGVKEITEFQLLANGQRRRTCNECRERVSQAIRDKRAEAARPVIGQHVFMRLRNDQQNDLNRIAALEAEIAHLRMRTVRRERFFEEYEALAEGAE